MVISLLTLFDSKTRFTEIDRNIDSQFFRFTMFCWAVTSAKLSEQWIIYLCVTSVAYLYLILSFTVYAGGATCGWTTSQPGWYETLNRCWFHTGPASQTNGQLWSSIESASRVWLQLWPISEPVEDEKSGLFLLRLGQCWVILPLWYNTDSDNAYFIYDYDRIYCFNDTTLQGKHDKKVNAGTLPSSNVQV